MAFNPSTLGFWTTGLSAWVLDSEVSQNTQHSERLVLLLFSVGSSGVPLFIEPARKKFEVLGTTTNMGLISYVCIKISKLNTNFHRVDIHTNQMRLDLFILMWRRRTASNLWTRKWQKYCLKNELWGIWRSKPH